MKGGGEGNKRVGGGKNKKRKVRALSRKGGGDNIGAGSGKGVE